MKRRPCARALKSHVLSHSTESGHKVISMDDFKIISKLDAKIITTSQMIKIIARAKLFDLFINMITLR